MTTLVGLCIPARQRSHGKLDCSLDGVPTTESTEETRLGTADEIRPGARAMAAYQTDDKLVRRSDDNPGSTPPDTRPPGSKYSVPTLEEAESALSKSEMSRFRRLRSLFNTAKRTRTAINKSKSNGMQPARELTTLLDRLKRHESAYQSLQREVLKRLMQRNQAPAKMVEQFDIRSERNAQSARASFNSMTGAERSKAAVDQKNRYQAKREKWKTLEARVDAGDLLTRRELKTLDRLRALFQRRLDMARMRYRELTTAEREAGLARQDKQITEDYRLLKMRWEDLRAKIRARKASAEEREEFKELDQQLRGELKTAKTKADGKQTGKKKDEKKAKAPETASHDVDPKDADSPDRGASSDTTKKEGPSAQSQGEQQLYELSAKARNLDTGSLVAGKNDLWTRLGDTIEAGVRGAAAPFASVWGKASSSLSRGLGASSLF